MERLQLSSFGLRKKTFRGGRMTSTSQETDQRVPFLYESFFLHAHTRKTISSWSQKQTLLMFTIMMHVRSCAVWLIGTSQGWQRPELCEMWDEGCCQHFFPAASAATGALPPGAVLMDTFWPYLFDLSVLVKINISTVLHEYRKEKQHVCLVQEMGTRYKKQLLIYSVQSWAV